MDRSALIPFLVLAITTVLFEIASNPCAAAAPALTTESLPDRTKRTIGSASSFINCITVLDGVGQRFCSYDQSILEAIERTATKGPEEERKRLPCPPRKTFRKQCNVCECLANGVLTCTTDLCAEEFYDANGLPKYW
ncbi:uncharacterized protein LOC110679215 [Aedes aegypti]|uniref:Uncharacterized protein n=1 Tax=Aedes aegypti TaxID=7159 RepID=A0A6I8TT81_AEDAE|nr:uncharacterized protein LOC110679215 [Aedes aegypti]